MILTMKHVMHPNNKQQQQLHRIHVKYRMNERTEFNYWHEGNKIHPHSTHTHTHRQCRESNDGHIA